MSDRALLLLIISLGFSLYVGHHLTESNKNLSIRKEAHVQELFTPNSKVGQEEPKTTKIIPSPTIYAGKSWLGKVSHYSRSGCLGCSTNMTMANGQPLDDSRATIAFNWLPMNSKVLITNLDNGKSIEAVVTDTGGFNALNRIADLTPAVSNYLGTITDVTNIKIQKL